MRRNPISLVFLKLPSHIMGSIRKPHLVIGSVLAVTLLFNSVIYACSKIGMIIAMHGASMSMATTDDMNQKSVERDPCAQHKQDVCKSIRDRLLSLQPSLYKLDPAQHVIIAPPSNPATEITSHIAAPFGSLRWQTAFHSVFKLPLRISLSVFRI